MRVLRQLAFGVVGVAALLAPAAASAAPGDLEFISKDSTGLASNGDSIEPVLSDSGNLVTFFSNGTNLAPGITTGVGGNQGQVYLRDVNAGTISLVSRASLASGNAPANTFSDEPDITGDGRFVVFESNATNLSPSAPTSGTTKTYIRDLSTGVTSLVSIKNDGFTANSGVDPVISSNGRFVAFATAASGIGDVNGPDDDIIVRDLQAGTNKTASQQTGVATDDDSDDPSISDDGRFVAFSSKADNLVADDDNTQRNIFVHDMQTNTTTLVSRATGAAGAGANGNSENPDISGNGRFVTFGSNAANLGAGGVTQIFVRDLQTNTTTLVSKQSTADGGAPANDGPGVGGSSETSISNDGRFVAFQSKATNLSTIDQDQFSETYVRDTVAGTTTLVARQSPAAGGSAADGDGFFQPDISGDGRWVSFSSTASNLSANDLDGTEDIYRSDFLGPTATDTTPPQVKVKKKGKAKLGKPIKIVLSTDEAVTVEAGATAKAGKKKVKYKGAKDVIPAGGSSTLTLKPSKRSARLLKMAGKAKVKVAITSTDLAGNESDQKLKIKLK